MELAASMILHPIGVVRSKIRHRKAIPPLGAPATIELLPEFADGLLRLEKHSHIWVLAWLDQAERDLLQVTPRGVKDQGLEGLHGVFAVRSPVRPNSIGLTVTRILRIRGTSIDVDLLDFLDSTPVIDLKPYFASRDVIFSATNEQIGRPASRESMRESLLFQAENFHGEQCVQLALAVRVVENFRSEILQMTEPTGWAVRVPIGRPCLIDAVMGITRASPGRGSLGFHEVDSVEFEHDAMTYGYELIWRGDSADEVLGAPDDRLFRFTASNTPQAL